MKYEIMTFKLLQYHIVKYDTMANIDYIFYMEKMFYWAWSLKCLFTLALDWTGPKNGTTSCPQTMPDWVPKKLLKLINDISWHF